MTRIYFAHPFETWKTPQEAEIADILQDRNLEVVNPFDLEDALNEKYGVKSYYDNPTKIFASEIYEKDYALFQTCDEYFGWFPHGVTMIGTPIELTWAVQHGKPVTVLCDRPSPFLWHLADAMYVGVASFLADEPFGGE